MGNQMVTESHAASIAAVGTGLAQPQRRDVAEEQAGGEVPAWDERLGLSLLLASQARRRHCTR